GYWDMTRDGPGLSVTGQVRTRDDNVRQGDKGEDSAESLAPQDLTIFDRDGVDEPGGSFIVERVRDGDECVALQMEAHNVGGGWTIPHREPVELLAGHQVELPDDILAVDGVDRLFVAHRSEEHTSELQPRENLVCR